MVEARSNPLPQRTQGKSAKTAKKCTNNQFGFCAGLSRSCGNDLKATSRDFDEVFLLASVVFCVSVPLSR